MIWEADTTQTLWGFNQPVPLYPGDTAGTHPNRHDAANVGGVNAYRWTEGIFIGYRYLDKMADLGASITPAFPWGWGLSYTTFAFSNQQITKAGSGYDVKFDITNTGSVAGAEVGMVFLGAAPSGPSYVQQAVRALRGFVRVELQPGQTVTKTIHVGPGADVDGYGDPRALQYWDTPTQQWATNDNCRTVWIGDADTLSRLPLLGTVGACATTTTVTSTFNPTQFGKPVTFTANVAETVAHPNPMPITGTVQFAIDGVNAGSPVALDASGNATLGPITTLAIGTHSITAAYSGDANYPASSGSMNQSVKKRLSTSVAVTSGLNPSVFGGNVTYTATITPENASSGLIPTGTVQFKADGVVIGGPQAVDALTGKATLTWNSLLAGHRNIRAVYSGDGNYTGSTSPAFVQTVRKAVPTGIVTADIGTSPMTITYGTKPITFTATFTNTAGMGSLQPAMVQFLIDGTNIGSAVTLNASNQALVTVNWNLPIGKHTIKAKYLGSANFAPVLSAGYLLTIH